MGRTHARVSAPSGVFAAALITGLVATTLAPVPGAAAHDGHRNHAPNPPTAAEMHPGFQDREVIGDISEPVAVAFAPDGTAFVALKFGIIKSWDYDPETGEFEPNATHTDFANLGVNVNNYWDRGLTGITVDPQFPTRPYIYVNYAYNRDPRDNPPVVPKWGDPDELYDECPSDASMGNPHADPPVRPTPGCLVNIRVSRLTAVEGPDGWVMKPGSELPLLEGACMQFPSHASGDVRIGPDGWLYASAGDGASFDIEDYGQGGNPCPGDSADEGGSLRSQDIRTAGDALSVSGAIFRVNPDTGLGADGSDSNASRIVTYGQRNPWRFTFRPGTNELWSADVGGNSWEEINRTTVSAGMNPVNMGWPCYEGAPPGPQRHPGWDALDKPVCESLYAAGTSAVRAPYFGYETRGPKLTPAEDCQFNTSSVSGVAFVPSSSSYPSAYRGSLFFSDYARGCIWRLGKLGNGDPDPNTIHVFAEAAQTPVGLVVGPSGDLYYVDYGLNDEGVPTPNEGGIHRLAYSAGNQAPTAAVTADPTSGPAPLTVDFDASGSSDPDGDPLTYAWDLDGDGRFDDGTGATRTRVYYESTPVTVTVRVSDGRGGTDTESVTISPGNTPPSLRDVVPSPSFTWHVGEAVSFEASATDAQQTLADPAYTWNLSVRHCPGDVCHTHSIQSWTGQRTGTFAAPDHEYPSHLLLTVTVTDDHGLSDTKTVRLDPETVDLQFASSPTGVPLTVSGADRPAPFTQTFVVGSHFHVTAPASTTREGIAYTFGGWSDGGARSHEVIAPGSAATYTAWFVADAPIPPALSRVKITTRRPGLRFKVNGKVHSTAWVDDLHTGSQLRVAAPKQQWYDGHLLEFVRWSDGGQRKHTLRVGTTGLRLRAIYRRVR